MVAHLAIADALRHGTRTTDAALATATLLVLTGNQVEALDTLETLGDALQEPGVAQWSRGLRMRVDDDWRVLQNPAAASRLEQREYVRARRTTVSTSTGVSTLRTLGVEPDADWIRIVVSSSSGVVDGSLGDAALDYERAEYEHVFAAYHGRAIGDDPAPALNQPSQRCVSNDGVQVLPWGAWAEFAQRHIAFAVGRRDRFVRDMLGAHERADAQKAALHREFGRLWAFPLGTLFWTKGRNGTEADSTYLDEAVNLLLESPQRINANVWATIELGTKYEPVRHGVPRPRTWFTAPEPRTAYDAAARLEFSGHPHAVPVLDQMLARSPADWGVAFAYLTEKYGNKAKKSDVEQVAGRRMEYDLRPIQLAIQQVADREQRLTIERLACGLTSSWCASYAKDLASLGRDADAAHAYEMAFADPEFDAVSKSNQSAWLVRYYASHDRVTAALALAAESASTASFQGLTTAARLYEQLGRYADAEKTFTDGAEHYDNWSELAGFYYRRTQVHKDRQYLDAWRDSIERVFPDGLHDDPPGAARPARGVFVEKGSAESAYYNLRTGDVIVAVDGWRVANVAQYRAVRAFPIQGRVVLTVWRGAGTSEVIIPDRDFVPYFTVVDYPLKGWIE
jgi:hypothetical protein